jgi:hypothetical protein
MKEILFLFLLLQSSVSFSQNLEGVWEGVVKLSETKSDRLNFRLELMQEGNDCYGVLYTRGYQKKVMFGCDYIVTGGISEKTLQLKWANVQRSVSMKDGDCTQMAALLLKLKDSVTLEGIWQWILGESVPAVCKKVSDSISLIAKDEFLLFKSSLLKSYEEKQVYLNVEERFVETILDKVVDSSELILEFHSTDSTSLDSIGVFLNGEGIAFVDNLYKNPLRLRLKELPQGENDLIIVNRNLVQFRQKIKVNVYYKGTNKELIAEPSFVKNSLILFKRN